MNEIRGALKGVDYGSPLVKYRGERILKLVKLLSTNGDSRLDPLLAIDSFYSLYLPAPVVDDSSQREDCKVIVKTFIFNQVGLRLRSKTVLDSMLSTITSSVFLARLYDKLPDSAGITGNHVSIDTKMLPEKANEVMKDVVREIEDVSRIRFALEGFEPGNLSILSTEDYGLELLRLAREADVKKVLDVLEGIKYNGLTTSRKYRVFKRGEKRGYELGSDLERLSPRNLLYGDEVFYAKLLQGKLLLYNKVVQESTSPIYVLVDKSGSMEGEKILWAKAVSLALYMKSIRSRREFYVRIFDSQPYSVVKVSRNPTSTEAIRVLEYVARVKSGGGTDITRALVTALADIERENSYGGTIVLITDGIDRVTERPIKELLKKTDISIVTIMIKGQNESLASLSKEYLKVVKLTTDEVLRVVKAIDKASGD